MARSLQFRGGEIPEGGGEGQITRDLARGGANPWGGGEIPATPGPNNLCWNDRPCKSPRHKTLGELGGMLPRKEF